MSFGDPNKIHGKWIWVPPPCPADVALEQLCLACLKRVKSTNLVVSPRLLTLECRRHLHKFVDFVIECAVGQSFWDTNMHEPLVDVVCFPFPRRRP